jgi:hypothetical protein
MTTWGGIVGTVPTRQFLPDVPSGGRAWGQSPQSVRSARGDCLPAYFFNAAFSLVNRSTADSAMTVPGG